MNTWILVLIALVGLKVITECILSRLNIASVKQHSGAVPEAFKDVMDQETYDKSNLYTIAKERFSIFSNIYEGLILVSVLYFGWIYAVHEFFVGIWGSESIWAQSATLASFVVLLGMIQWPLEWWQQFSLEEKFGFNRSNQALWVSDHVKGIVLTYAFGIPVACAIIAFFNAFPQTWWIWAAGFIIVFQVVMLLLYPTLILPLFNKLSPMEEGELKERLLKLADSAGFKASTIEVMDGSKRSGHSNAFFTGFGKFRRIVLFDTLVEQLSVEQLEAVLAHEIGHYKKGHIPQRLFVSSAMLLITFGALAWCIAQPSFYEAFGFTSTAGIVPALAVFLIYWGSVAFWITPMSNFWSRKHEYEADDFAKKAVGSATPLVESLRKLSKENLSNLTPHPLYSAFNYSHPTLLERETALNQS